jgi:hypothetical protein
LAGLGIEDAVYRHATLLTQSDTAIKASGLFELIGMAKRSATGSQQRRSNGLALVSHDLFPIHLYFKRLPSCDTQANSSFTLGHMLPFLCSTVGFPIPEILSQCITISRTHLKNRILVQDRGEAKL